MKDISGYKIDENELDKVIGGISDEQLTKMDSFLNELRENKELTGKEVASIEEKLVNSKDSDVLSYLEKKALNNNCWEGIYNKYKDVMGLEK